MKMGSQKLSIEKYDISKLNQKDLQTFYNIEKDSLAYFYNELKICDWCGTIYDKKDVYWQYFDWKVLSVKELENKYWSKFETPCCNSGSHDYRDENKVYDIQLRLWNKVLDIIDTPEEVDEWPIESYCTVVKNEINEIVGFCYGYVDTLDKIYDRELSFHFTKEVLKHPTIKTLNEDNFMTIWWAFILQQYMNQWREAIALLYNLRSWYANNVKNEHQNLTWIFEAKEKTASYKIFCKQWAKPLNLKEHEKYIIQSKEVQLLNHSDLFIHPFLIHNYISRESILQSN